MSSYDTVLSKNILLDSDIFKSAADQFAALSDEMSALRKDIASLLDELEKGFDTPAGRKFIKSCRNGLLQPMDDQAVVIKHVSDNLSMARSKYETVFTEFQALNNIINQQ
jgi:hypothetical protein